MKSLLKIVACCILFTPILATADVSNYLYIPDMPGDSDLPEVIPSAQKANTISIVEYSTGITNTAKIGSGSSGAGAGKATLTSLTFVKYLNQASGFFFKDCAQGDVISSAVFTTYKNAGTVELKEIWQLDLSKGIITSVTLSNDDTGTPTEVITVTFESVKWKYFPTKVDGTPGTPITGSF